MSILIRKKNEEVKLIFKDNIDFITEDFLGLIAELTELNQKLIGLEQDLKNREKSSIQAQNKLQTALKEQKNIDAEIKKILATKDACYKNLKGTLEHAELLSANKMLGKLLDRLKQADFNISQVTIQIRHNSKATDNIHKQQEITEQKIEALRSLLQIEYQKINWEKLNNSHICLSLLFEQVKNEKLKQLLKNITRSNFELEKSIILILSKVCTKLLNNSKGPKLCKMLDEINILLKINNMIYDFISDLLSRNNLTVETVYLLQQLEYLLSRLNNYAKYSLNKDKTLDMSTSIVHLKSISELNKKTVIQNYRPAIFYRKKLESYNLDSKRILSIVGELERYLKSVEQTKETKPKTYFIQ